MKDIGSGIARAAMAQGATAVVGKAATVVSTILLARLLYPEDFGLQTFAFMVMGLANMFSNFGFQTYIIQAKKLSTEQLDICFTLNIVFSAVLGLLVGSIGFVWPATPLMFREMLVLYGAMIFVSGLSYSQLAVMKRQLQFRGPSRAELAFSLTSSFCRVVFAFAGFGALCFPMGDLLGALVRWLASRQIGGVSLRMRMPRGAESGEVLRFGAYTTSVGLASFVANQVDKALLTATHPAASIGFYGFATTMSAMFYNAFIVPQSSVFLAAFARLQDDINGARKILAASSRFIFSLALPLNVMWLLEAERIVTVVFGDRWLEAAPLIRILAVDYLVRSMFSGITGLQLSFGRAREAALTKWLNSALFVTFMLVAWAVKMDIQGYAMMFVAASILSTAHNIHVNGKLVNFNLAPYLGNLLAPAAIALVSTAVWWLARREFSTRPALLPLAVAGGAWLTTYIALTGIFNRIVVDQLGVIFQRRSNKS